MVGSGSRSAMEKYKQGNASEVMYATPHRLVQMLMEGALDKIATAKGCVSRNDFEGKNNMIKWAIAIIHGLQDSLNMNEGGEIANNLFSLYEYMSRRLSEANAQSDIAALDEVTSLLQEIKGAWDSMPEYIRYAATLDEIRAKEAQK